MSHAIMKLIKDLTLFVPPLQHESSIYASDVEGTLFPETMKRWDINRFTSDDSVLHKMNEDECMKGIHWSFLNIGSRGSLFSFHVEDQNLNSISFLHEGVPKV